MRILGLSAGFHDAAITTIDNAEILFAGHSERYSKKKHDANICGELLAEGFADPVKWPEIIAYYERPWVKKTRQLYAGQYSDAFDMSNLTTERYLKSRSVIGDIVRQESWQVKAIKYEYHNHHLSHAASGFQTSTFDKATIVVIDAIGEWDTISIYGAEYDDLGDAKYTKLWSQKYPNSIGLFYSAFTQHVGLKPLDEEYILMGMSGYGSTKYYAALKEYAIDSIENLQFNENFHMGVMTDRFNGCEHYDLAASVQHLTEELIEEVMQKACNFGWSGNLVYAGGVALNCLANRLLGKYFDKIWIMPNPGDAGSSLGAAALVYGKRLNWQHPYLGSNMGDRYPVRAALEELLMNKIVGVASGRAEFGPRALGNRSLLADPRGPEIKDKVNEIKRRQKFRPFAPAILEEFVDQYFDMPMNWTSSPYMQVTAKCKYPDLFPAIVHVDNTSRVQTVSKDCGSGLRQLLEEWYKATNCPMLLNTSLNIRGEPMVNDFKDAQRFEQEYGTRVVTGW